MAIIKPFTALRPIKEMAEKVASRPYDVLNREEAKEETKYNSQSFLHITKAEVDLPDTTEIYSAAVYEKANENLKKFQDDGVLFIDKKPGYYIYQLIMDGREQTGLVAASAVKDYEEGIIKKHEFTRPEKEKDRIDHMIAIKAQTGKVFLAYNNIAELDAVINDWKLMHEVAYDFIASDNIQHTIWVVDDDNTIQIITNLFREKVPSTYIADGHHRAASAAKLKQALPSSTTAHFFLTVLFPAASLSIMDYNRVIKDLNNFTTEAFIQALEEDFEIALSSRPIKPSKLHEFGMYINNKWYQLHSKPNTYNNDSMGILDITIFTKNILNKLLNIQDQRIDKRIDFVGGIRGLQELEKRVNSGEMKVAFSFYPVTVQQLFDIADSGAVMPPKSTWFEPKLRDGLLTYLL